MLSTVRQWVFERKVALLCCVVFVAAGVMLASHWIADRQAPVVRMSAGSSGSRRHTVAEYLREQSAKNDLSVELETCAGSEDCLNRLKAGTLDVAVVSNGVVVPDDDEIMVLGAFQLEAVHMLVRKSMADIGPLATTIRGKRVNIGEKGSCEWLLARDLVAFARLKVNATQSPDGIVPTEYGKAALVSMANAILQATGETKERLIADLPDCLLVLDTLPSTVAQKFAEAADYRLMPLLATRAFLLDKLQKDSSTATVLEREFLERTQIPANSYLANQPFPATDCETVGMRLLIVARKNTPAEAIAPLMKTIFEGEFSRRILPKSPRDIAAPYAIHPAAVAYLDRDKPLAVKEVVDSIRSAFSLFGVFSAGALSLYGLLWRKKSRKPGDYFEEIRKVELIARGASADPAIPVQPSELTTYLDDRLLKLRQDLIEDICEGRIKGDQIIANILTLLSDARRGLAKRGNTIADRLDSAGRLQKQTSQAA